MRPPRLHLFSYIREGAGFATIGPATPVNASPADRSKDLARAPITQDV